VPRIEEALLAVALGGMILLAALQIGLRAFLGTGIPWADPLLRVLVLWVGLLGAVTASRDGRHITIDVLSRLLPARARAAAGALTGLFAAGVAGVLAWHGARFVASEREFESVAFSGIPAWALESVIPGAFALIALRSLWRGVLDLRAALRGAAGEEGAR
jgi:TRAP-type C4-dicarboxylate transport system permease small subunit